MREMYLLKSDERFCVVVVGKCAVFCSVWLVNQGPRVLFTALFL